MKIIFSQSNSMSEAMQFTFDNFLFHSHPQDYLYNLDQLDYDTQNDLFLGLKTLSQVNLRDQTQNQSFATDNFQTQPISESLQSPSNSSVGTNIFQTNNKFHNFQKHTVTALRSIINFEMIRKLCQNQNNLAAIQCLWRDFLNIKGKKIMTKKFLFTFFCGQKSHLKDLSSFGFTNSFKKFSEDEIICAQVELREIVYKSFSEQKIRAHVGSRKLERKEEFILYLQDYRQKELSCGVMKKRMPKQNSNHLIRLRV